MILAILVGLSSRSVPSRPAYLLEEFPAPQIMRSAVVRKELGLTVDEAYGIFEKRSREFNIVQLGRRDKKTSQERRNAMARILSDLGPERQKRLGQLYIQAYGASSLLDPKVAAKVQLTTRQLATIDSTHRDAMQRYLEEKGVVLEKIRKIQPPEPKELMALKANPMSEEARRIYDAERPRLGALYLRLIQQAREKSLPLLNSQQRKRFDSLKGKPAAEELGAEVSRRFSPF